MSDDIISSDEAASNFRCFWCGKSTADLKPIHPKLPRRYCSRSCSAASSYFLFIFMSIIFPIMLIVQLLLIIEALPEGFTVNILIQYLLLPLDLALVSVSWYYLLLGHRKRKETPRYNQRRNGAAGVI